MIEVSVQRQPPPVERPEGTVAVALRVRYPGESAFVASVDIGLELLADEAGRAYVMELLLDMVNRERDVEGL